MLTVQVSACWVALAHHLKEMAWAGPAVFKRTNPTGWDGVFYASGVLVKSDVQPIRVFARRVIDITYEVDRLDRYTEGTRRQLKRIDDAVKRMLKAFDSLDAVAKRGER